jgi:hypothetical protein
MAMFNTLLEKAGLDPANVQLVRHQRRDRSGLTIYDLWRSNRKGFERYQSIQGPGQKGNPRFRVGGQIASFVATPERETLFVGVYHVAHEALSETAYVSPFTKKRYAPGDRHVYELDPRQVLSDFVGRLKIDWGRGRRWVQHADRQNKAVAWIDPNLERGKTTRFGAPAERIGTRPQSGPSTQPIRVGGEASRDVFRPSQGVVPSFGTRQITTNDGVHYLYLMKLKGDLSAIIGRQTYSLVGKCLVKVGYSNDPVRRCEELNAAFPPAGQFEWHLAIQSKEFRDGASAKAVEDQVKAEFDRVFESLGGEFFLGQKNKIEAAFNRVASR